MYKIGILGFGVVGKSALALLAHPPQATINVVEKAKRLMAMAASGCKVTIWDKRVLDDQEQALLMAAGATQVDAGRVLLADFLASTDIVIASPGVDLSSYQVFSEKIVTELDIFSAYFQKPVVAITGSAGKTTVTKLLGALASMLSTSDGHPCRVVIGGNVGIGMLDLIGKQDEIDVAVIELSSFQLEFNQHFSPSVAIYTNLYPNHLDRHKTLAQYWQAKAAMVKKQVVSNVVILSHELAIMPMVAETFASKQQNILITADHELAPQSIKLANFSLLYPKNNAIMLATYQHGRCEKSVVLIDQITFPDITFLANWLQVLAGLYALGLVVERLPSVLTKAVAEGLLPAFAHRVRLVASLRGVDFYDDSKSTIAQATLAAVVRLAKQGRPIMLILGGLGKGIDRSWLMGSLKAVPGIKKVLSFGPERAQFAGSVQYETLEEVIDAIGQMMVAGDVVLFSPSGTSFDFFKNYEHRGLVFEQLVQRLA